MEKRNEFETAWAKIVAKAWTDPEFKKRLLEEPIAAFKELGIAFPEGVDCKVKENTENTFHLAIPVMPQGVFKENSLTALSSDIPSCSGISNPE